MKNELFIRTGDTSRTGVADFSHSGTFPTYREAVLRGQEIAGYGNFYVDTGLHVPTSSEQLLEPIRHTARAAFLDTI